MKNHLNRVILLGGSAGSLEAVVEIISRLEADLPAAVFLVLHLAGPAPSIEAKLASVSSLPVAFAKAGEPVEAGRIYIAPPDHHTLLQADAIHLSRGPKVNRTRPSIDLTFRSAAVAYGAQSIGVILSGMLDDGVAGLQAIQRCGGVTVIQDPADAPYAEMPENALAYVDATHTLPAAAIGGLLNQLAKITVASEVTIPADIVLENQFDMNNTDDFSQLDQLGKRAPLSCPECGGLLWEIEQDSLLHYRCHTGHSFSVNNLLMHQEEEIEHTLWIALRTLEEKVRMQEGIFRREQASGREKLATSFQQQAIETRAYADRLRKLLVKMGGSGDSPIQ